MIHIYYSKRIKNYLYQLTIVFLLGGIFSLLLHRNDHLFFSRGLAVLQVSNEKLAEMKKMNAYTEKRLKRYLARTEAFLDDSNPTQLEKWKRKEFERLERKYRHVQKQQGKSGH